MSQGHGLHWWTSRYGRGKATAHPVLVVNWGDLVHVEGLTGRWKGRRFSVVRNEITTYVPLGAKLAPGARAYAKLPEKVSRNTERDMSGKRYRVVAIVTKTGRKVVMAPGPFTHREATTVLSKITRHPWRREMVEEIGRSARDCIGVHTHDARVSTRYLSRASRDRGRGRTKRRAKSARNRRTRR